MYYVYVVIVLALVAIALWAMVSFHYVLQQQRKLNAFWGVISQMLLARNEILGDLQNLWVSPAAQLPKNHLAQLQALLAQDTTVAWQDVEQRSMLRKQIDAEGTQLIAQAKTQPHVAQNQRLQAIEQRLVENASMILRDADMYNRTARLYNSLLQVNPNRFIAGRLKLSPATLFHI
jgi:hypothetical protein